MKSSISRSAAWLFTTRKRTPDEVVAALDDKTEAVIREPASNFGTATSGGVGINLLASHGLLP